MRIIYIAFLLLLVCLPVLLIAQQGIINGRVINDDSDALMSVLVQVKGTKAFTTTGTTGAFHIAVPGTADSLVFTLPGYQPAVYRVTDKDRIKPVTIILRPVPSDLADVVIARDAVKRRVAGIAFESPTPGYTATSKIATMSFKKETLRISTLRVEKKTGDAHSNMLTAGELNDFKKWKLWEDYTGSSFLELSSHWGISLKERYCVQLQNQQHIAIPGEKVSLIVTGTKDTVWQAVTDNTGKAELWGNVFRNGFGKSRYSLACKNTVINSPVQFEDGINRITVKQGCNVSDIVEMAFVVDATGSMSDEIRYLQEELQDVIGKTAARYKGVQLRSAAVFYRDHSDEYLTRHINFTTVPSELIGFVKQQGATGGGDYPEAVEDALATALDSLEWGETARAKILFLILDAPPHDKARDRITKQVQRAAKKGIRIVPVVCSGVDKSTEYLMRSIALATNGTYVFLTDDSGIGNSHIKPTTDEFKVELLNDLLQRLINEMVFVPHCDQNERAEPIGQIAHIVKVSVFPTPSSGIVTIDCNEAIKEILVTDFTGKVLMRPAPLGQKGRLQIDLSNYPSGTYLLKYYVTGKGWGAEKIVIVH